MKFDKTEKISQCSRYRVLLFIPNIIDYIRLIILLIAWLNFENTVLFCGIYIFGMWLDDIDGNIGRRLNQCSEFGAWLDVAVDNISRGLLWISIYPKIGYIISCIEWLSFVCTHTRGPNWKEIQAAPWIIHKIMENGLWTPLGFYVTYSMYLLPMTLIIFERIQIGITLISVSLISILLIGRFLAFLAEIWFISHHVQHLLDKNTRE